jgi:hypothetical protein
MEDKLYDLKKSESSSRQPGAYPVVHSRLYPDHSGQRSYYAAQIIHSGEEVPNSENGSPFEILFGYVRRPQYSKDLDKIELLAASSENFNKIGPLIKNIKAHLRDVKNQMIDDFKMVITIIE